MLLGLEIRNSQFFDTHLNTSKFFTRDLDRISMKRISIFSSRREIIQSLEE
jgi:hypothetical protein